VADEPLSVCRHCGGQIFLGVDGQGWCHVEPPGVDHDAEPPSTTRHEHRLVVETTGRSSLVAGELGHLADRLLASPDVVRVTLETIVEHTDDGR
jgi:hypothetical protein